MATLFNAKVNRYQDGSLVGPAMLHASQVNGGNRPVHLSIQYGEGRGHRTVGVAIPVDVMRELAEYIRTLNLLESE